MLRSFLVVLLLFALTPTTLLLADDNLEVLESVVSAREQIQPGLQNYLVSVETSRIEEMMSNLTSGKPADVPPPPAPSIVKFWQRNGTGLIYAKQERLHPYVEKMVKQLSANLAVELNEMILPREQAEARRMLAKSACVKSSEVALANQLIRRTEITFDDPTDLNGAFYVSGMRLPQSQVTQLTFDVNTGTNTVNEISVAAGELRLTVEIRYIEVDGGYIPERFQITSPDGKIDDLFEVSLAKIDDFVLPTSMQRTIRRPDLQDELTVFFKGYQVNQPIPEDIQSRLKGE